MRYNYVVEVLDRPEAVYLAVNGTEYAQYTKEGRTTEELEDYITSGTRQVAERIQDTAAESNRTLTTVVYDSRAGKGGMWVAYRTPPGEGAELDASKGRNGILSTPPQLDPTTRYTPPGATPAAEPTPAAPSYIGDAPSARSGGADEAPPAPRTTRRNAPRGTAPPRRRPTPARAATAVGTVTGAPDGGEVEGVLTQPQRKAPPRTSPTAAEAQQVRSKGVRGWWQGANPKQRGGAVAVGLVVLALGYMFLGASGKHSAVCVDVRTQTRTLDPGLCDGSTEFYKWYYYKGGAGKAPQVNEPYLSVQGTFNKPGGSVNYIRTPSPMQGDDKAPSNTDSTLAPKTTEPDVPADDGTGATTTDTGK